MLCLPAGIDVDRHQSTPPCSPPQEARRGWAPVANLDVFFQTMYRYYQSKGFNSILAATTTNLLSMAFTVALSAWLLAFVDWGKLTTCHDEESCLSFGHYIHARVRGLWLHICTLVCTPPSSD